jgi:hypothetical protein
MLLVGKFASASTARAPLSTINVPTHQQADDVATLNMLQDFIVNAYRPGDIVLLVMSQSTSLCIGHQDLVSVNFLFLVQYSYSFNIHRLAVVTSCVSTLRKLS